MSDAERVELGDRIRQRRERAFGTKKAAYQEAQVNAATWDKAEQGDRVRPDLLRRIVRTLWPASEGDWTAIEAPGGTTIEERVAELERLVRQLAEPERRDVDSTPVGEDPQTSGQPGASA